MLYLLSFLIAYFSAVVPRYGGKLWGRTFYSWQGAFLSPNQQHLSTERTAK